MELTLLRPLFEPRSYPAVPRVGVGAVVVHQQKLLMVQRNQPPAKHLWTLPGGLVEVGESLEQALEREVLEECGLNIRLLRVLDVVEYIDVDDDRRIRYHYIIIDYLATYLAGEARPASDVAAAAWVAQADLARLEMPELTRNFINNHRQHIWP